MTSLLDVLFSREGRVDRKTWLLATLGVAGAAMLGVVLFNEDNFDESAHAISEAPTMAAFLWVAICVYVLGALHVKRMTDAARSRSRGLAFAVASAGLVAGWGLGAFRHPFTSTIESAAFWLLATIVGLALFEAATRPTAPPQAGK